MKYTLDKIDTVAACDALMASAQKKRQSLERRLRNLGASIARFRDRLDQVGQDMTLIQAMLVIYTEGYNKLPEGSKYKLDINIKIKRLEVRHARLALKAFSCNEHALLAKQVKYNGLRAQLAAVNAYIADVRNRKAELENVAAGMDQANTFLGQPVVYQKSQMKKTSYKINRRFYPMNLVQQSPLQNSLTEVQKDAVLVLSHPPARVAASY